MPRISRTTGVEPLPDRYGRESITGSKSAFTERKCRALNAVRGKFSHRNKNGVHDPYSFFHLAEELAHIAPWKPFTAAQLADWLNGTRPQFIWDPITVGRILNDLREGWEEANPGKDLQPMHQRRAWNGVFYEMTDFPAGRKVLANLIEDLSHVADEVYKTERSGKAKPRLTSPLAACASLVRTGVAAAMAVMALGGGSIIAM